MLTLAGGVTYTATGNPLGASISGILGLGTGTRTFTIGDSTNATNDLDVSAIVTDGTFSKAGAGQLRLSGAASNTAAVSISAGTLLLDKSGAYAVGSAGLTVSGGTVTLQSANQIHDSAVLATSGGAVDFQTFNETVGTYRMSGAHTIQGSAVLTAAALEATSASIQTGNTAQVSLTGNYAGSHASGSATWNMPVGLSGATSHTFSQAAGGTSVFNGVISGASESVVVSGSGTIDLRAINTYTGATTISAGMLALGSDGSIASSGTVTVGSAGSTGAVLNLTAMASSYVFDAGQTVGGVGTINIGAGKTVSSAGIWAPGNSIGSNAVTGNLSLTGTSRFELGTPGTSMSSPGTSDFTAVSGTLTLGGNLSLIDNAGADGNGSAAGGVYRLFTYGTGVSGSYDSVTTNPTPTTRTSLANITYGGSGTAVGQGVFLSVFNLAAGSVTSGTSINFGTVLKNTPLSQSLTISNTAPLGIFSEGLNGAFGTLSGGATTNGGSISLLSAGGTSTALSVGLGSATAGVTNGSALINFFSDGAGTSGLAATSIGSQAVNLTATVLDPAVASFTSGSIPSTSLTLNFGSVSEGDSASRSFSLYNLLQTAGFTADLALLSINETNPSGPFSTDLTQFNNLASGSFNSWQVSLDPASQGTFSNTWTLQFKSASGGAVYTGATAQTLTLTASVIIVPEPGALALAGAGIALAGWAALRRRK
jgi:autotransporter-associated beta strand protein